MIAVTEDFSITIVGLGLIGGSIAKAIRENLKVKNLWAVDINKEALEEAKDSGIIDGFFQDDSIPLKGSDIVILCTYPNAALEFMRRNMEHFRKNAIITDTSGIKGKIVEEARKILRHDLEFIGGHPMSGKESTGYRFSDGTIFRGSNYIITPHESNSKETVLLLKNMMLKIGFRKVIELEPKTHDRIIAYTSQLPHILACTVMNSESFHAGRDCIGGSFKDMTRVADINGELWSELLIENKENILAELSSVMSDLEDIYHMIEREDADSLKSAFRKSGNLRKEMKYEKS